MKILVLQLARFGDIFITWPVLRALRRRFPSAEIHLVVRSRFSAAAQGCEAVDKVIQFDTSHFLTPIMSPPENVRESMLRLTEWTEILAEADYDQVINLSFSPFSSYLSSLIVRDPSRVRGYTRHEDGYLAIPDDASAYFYAQVGIGRSNRYHLADVFAAVANVELTNEDWRPSTDWKVEATLQTWREKHPELNQPYLVFHPGASQSGKIYPGFKWQVLLTRLSRVWPGKMVMIGNSSDAAAVEDIFGGDWLINLSGKTQFNDVVALIQGAEIIIGGDSAPMHLASFTQTPCLNLSFATVNFWETGPRVKGSRVLFAESPEALPSDRVVREAAALLAGQPSDQPFVICNGEFPTGYEWTNHKVDDFEWRFIQAIYTGGKWPTVQDAEVAHGLKNIQDAVEVGQVQLAKLERSNQDSIASRLLEQVDRAIIAVGQVVPALRPLSAWFETENIRLGPCEISELLAHYRKIYGQLALITDLYFPKPQPGVQR